MHDVTVFPLAILVYHISLASEPLGAVLVAAEVKIVIHHSQNIYYI